MKNVMIRPATQADAQEMLALYAPYVLDTAMRLRTAHALRISGRARRLSIPKWDFIGAASRRRFIRHCLICWRIRDIIAFMSA